jgi:hypothetical protein
MCPIPNGFRDRAISLYSSKIVDKKEILRISDFFLYKWLVVRKRTIPTEQPPLLSEVSTNFLRIEGVAWSAQRIPAAVNLSF